MLQSRFLLFVLLVLPVTSLMAARDAALRDEISSMVAQIGTPAALEIQGEAISSVIVIPALYQQRDYAPLWTNKYSIRQLLAAIRSIGADGLDPADYHLAALERLQQQVSSSAAPPPAQLAEYDLLLTDSLVRLGYHLMIGKVDPVELDQNWNMDKTVGDLDTVLAMADAVSNGTVDQLIDSLRPQAPIYAQMKAALARYQRFAEEGGWQPLPDGPALKPGMSDPRITALRQRLAVTGEFTGTDRQSSVYDEALEQAVRLFQRRHGLEDDGIIGKGTLQALNVPVEQRIDQLRVNLERARWILRDLPEDYVLVDIAGFHVRLVRDGNIVWETRAQVGKPYRKTPVFRSRITYMDVNPTWTVPPTILRKDVLPAIKRDPEYLQEKNMRVLDRQGSPVDPATIDWSIYPGTGFPYMVRQDPGPGNALGRVKFMFPNKHAVYLHDTPSKSLFNRTERAFSSGCIRIENPYDFAELLMDDPGTWSREDIQKVIETRETRSVTLPQPITVLLLYWTVDFDEDGTVVFRQDIYDRDVPILSGLQQPFRFRDRPVVSGLEQNQ
ncbi:MAG: L,D-transpeptidase family protein [Gammaproteobacteria bacterium]|nr:L,D-transpeptidase family protein [Gammaproteobacteria bacterium]